MYSDALHWITQIVLYLKDFIWKCKYFSSDCCNVFDVVVYVFSFVLSKSVTGVTCTLLIINASHQSVQSSRVDARLFEDLWWSRRLERKVKNDKNDPQFLIHLVNTWCWCMVAVRGLRWGMCIYVCCLGASCLRKGKTVVSSVSVPVDIWCPHFGCKEAVNILRSNGNVTKFMEIILLFWAVLSSCFLLNFSEFYWNKNDNRV